MDMKMAIAASAAAFIAIAAVAELVDLNWPTETPTALIRSSVEPQPFDRLSEVLIRCAEKGEAGGHDPDCLKAWAMNRRRFLGGGIRWHDDAPDRLGAPSAPATTAPVTPAEAR